MTKHANTLAEEHFETPPTSSRLLPLTKAQRRLLCALVDRKSIHPKDIPSKRVHNSMVKLLLKGAAEVSPEGEFVPTPLGIERAGNMRTLMSDFGL